MSLAQFFGNLRIFSSLPAFILYYLFYSSFENDDPEGRITDTTVCTHIDFELVSFYQVSFARFLPYIN